MRNLPEEGERSAPGALLWPGVPVVGIGASAGGLEALSLFFDATPGDSGSAFVVVIHLDPSQQSHMAEILATHTSMPVVEVTDGIEIAANNVYVIAPNHYLRLNGKTLNFVEPPTARGRRHPIDDFFESLAAQERERAVGVVLSGTGTNGTQGLKAIKAQGGLALVQDPVTAKFDGMPASAIAAGLADHVSSPSAMPLQILRYLEHTYAASPDFFPEELAANDPRFEEVITLLRRPDGHDFRQYKPTMMRRRIHRRMGLLNVPTLTGYIQLLRENPGEVQELIKDLLITVTNFFRDPEAWSDLDSQVIHRMIKNRESGDSLRVWVPACATGEEAYSVAMLLSDAVRTTGRQLDIKVFATDAQEENLRRARDGIYPEAALSPLPSEKLRAHFDKRDGNYQVKKNLRDLVVFAAQDLLADPPFSRLDLVSCRNLLIYLEPDTQQRLIALFHFTLREGGYLFLGSAETVGRHQELFTTISKKWRIYRRRGPTRHDMVHFPITRENPTRFVVPGLSGTSDPSASAADVARRALLDRHAPVSVLADADGKVLYFHGSTGLYLENPTGEPTSDLFALVKGGLGPRLRIAVEDAQRDKKPVKLNALMRIGARDQSVQVTVTPLHPAPPVGKTALVSFAPQVDPVAKDDDEFADQAQLTTAETLDAHSLREELLVTRSELESTIDHLGNTVEALRASNEEVTSMNEELQSANEELETSKEELQSFNEELHTINSQLEQKVADLEDTTNDLNNLLTGTEVATLFLDMDLSVKWFSPAVSRLFDLVPADIGRPIAHFARKFEDDEFLKDAAWVLQNLGHREAEVVGDGGQWFIRYMLPYRTTDHRIAGLVVTFTDITDRKRAADEINEARLYAEIIVSTVRQPLLVLNGDLVVQSANPAFYALFQSRPEQTLGRSIFALGTDDWAIPELQAALRKFLPDDKIIKGIEIDGPFDIIGQRSMLIDVTRLTRGGGREPLILLAIEDVTKQHEAVIRQKMLVGESKHRLKNTLATVLAIAHQTLRNAPSLEQARTTFEARIAALARTQDILNDDAWVGTKIANVVAGAVEPHLGGAERFRISGPDIELERRAAMALAMALHELFTNAAKYGALSSAGGHVEITWKVAGGGAARSLEMHWQESDGPAVEAPQKRGFGSRMIELALAGVPGGSAQLVYQTTGLVCTLTVSLPPHADGAVSH
jgi:two-component system CheB/CheR fusion protein